MANTTLPKSAIPDSALTSNQYIRFLSLDSTNDSQSKVDGLWQVEVFSNQGFPDRMAASALAMASELGIQEQYELTSAKGFLLSGQLSTEDLQRISKRLLIEPVVQSCLIAPVGNPGFTSNNDPQICENTVYVLPKPGVTDAEADSAAMAIKEMGIGDVAIRTFRKFVFQQASPSTRQFVASRVLHNDSIEQLQWGPLQIDSLETGSPARFEKKIITISTANDDELLQISRNGSLSLTLVEMQTIQSHYRELHREPTDIELETVAQTWSEHCSHKTLAGKIVYDDGSGPRYFNNMLKETIFAATQTIRAELGADDWCVSVFKDNAGVVKFTEDQNITFKVETHNRPSAIEPYGGANTGLGGVIRDTMGTGMGAKPICSTDVFCFATPDRPFEELPPGVMHPQRIMQGVVAGVRDYGNRMGIPTVNGAVFFDDRYIGNPMVFCGNVGLLPHDMSFKAPEPNDLIVSIGGRTGRDGIHGATFSSAEWTEESEKVSSGAVQIGNAIVEKMVLDVLLQARDRRLFNAVTDCGAGGFSSAVGEMGEEIGAEVWLEKAPLKYPGLTPTEIWISEAQERMVFAVPEKNWAAFQELCESESVEASAIGRFTPTGHLKLTFNGETIGELSMEFMHQGRPPVQRRATYAIPSAVAVSQESLEGYSLSETLHRILSAPNVASKHWIIRQYDHEVLGGSVIKPLVGANNDGPSDAAVVRPLWSSERGITISCGMNPLYGDLDTYHMAASSIDEAVRNCVAVGADPSRIGILDNFCWGFTDRPETLGSLVRAALACQDVAIAFRTPFISGKDSLNNEFSYTDPNGQRQTISIPSTLLISALGQVPDVSHCVTMDLKSADNILYLLGPTGSELGGSHALLVHARHGEGHVPQVDTSRALSIFQSLHVAINQQLVRSCHDLSEGGLAACLAEMCFAGELGADVDVSSIASTDGVNLNCFERLFAESNSRFVCEVPADSCAAFENCFDVGVLSRIGFVRSEPVLKVRYQNNEVLCESIAALKKSWQQTFDWK